MKFDAKDMKLMSNMAGVIMGGGSESNDLDFDGDMPELESSMPSHDEMNNMINNVMSKQGEIQNMVTDVLGDEQMMGVVMNSVQSLLSGINKMPTEGDTQKTIQGITSQLETKLDGFTKGKKQKPLRVNVSISLNDLFTGITKKIKVQRVHIDPNDEERQKCFYQKDSVKIHVPAGSVDGELIECKGLGHAYYHKGEIKRTPMIIRVQESSQVYGTPCSFQNGTLVYRVPVSLKDALFGGEFTIHTLDKQKLILKTTEGEIDFKHMHTLNNHFYPCHNTPAQVKFHLIMPDKSTLSNIRTVLNHPEFEFDFEIESDTINDTSLADLEEVEVTEEVDEADGMEGVEREEEEDEEERGEEKKEDGETETTNRNRKGNKKKKNKKKNA